MDQQQDDQAEQRDRREHEPVDDGRVGRRVFGRRAATAGGAVLGGAVLGGLFGPQVAAAATTDWSLTGNAGTAATNFLGTTDNTPLVVRTNNTEKLRVASSGAVGIGTATPTAKLHVKASSTAAGLFEHPTTTGATPALSAATASRDGAAVAVRGSVTDAGSAANSAGVTGVNAGVGRGVLGVAASGGVGVYGSAPGRGYGVYGGNFGTEGAGGQFVGGSLGVLAIATSAAGSAIRAQNTATGAFKGTAVQGYAGLGDDLRVHPGGGFWDAGGEFSGLNGVIGAASTEVSDGYGVIGLADNAIGVGVYARGTGGAKALVASGDADVLGTLTKFGGSFRIDHPLAPADRYLSHSFVESPDMKNIYDGVVVADGSGRATVTMPDWFEALNRDLRYQLTAIGGPSPDLHVAGELHGGRFTIAGARAGQKVSWQLTGIRQDAWANANRIPVEHDKSAAEKSRFLTPELHGADDSARIGDVQAGARRAGHI